MRSGARVDQLTGYADPIGALAHRALEHIPNTQFAAEPLHIDVLPLVGEARIAGDDGQPADPREGGGDLLDHPVGEIFLFRVRADVLKRQNGDGWSVWKRGVRGTGGHGKIRGLRRSGGGTSLRDAGRADVSIASSGQGLDPILAARLLPKHPT